MMRSATLRILVLSALLLAGGGCGSSLSAQAKKQRVEVATHPELVRGLEFVTGYTKESISLAGADGVGNEAANKAARDGYSDVVVLVELIGQLPSLSTYRVGIYRKPAAE